jgi:acetyl-CoA synthetase
MTEANISSMLNERRLFPPPAAFAKQARIGSREEYEKLYRESIDSPGTFWPRMAAELHWHEGWKRLLDDANPPF